MNKLSAWRHRWIIGLVVLLSAVILAGDPLLALADFSMSEWQYVKLITLPRDMGEAMLTDGTVDSQDLATTGLPTDRLTLGTGDTNFHRRVTLEGSLDGEIWRSISGSGEVYAFETPKFTGSKLRVDYPEVTYRYLRLSIHNQDDAPPGGGRGSCFRLAEKAHLPACPWSHIRVILW